MNFTGKSVIITGSSSGIGRETAIQFAKHGANVLLHGRNVAALQDAKAECIKAGLPGAKFAYVNGDLTENDTLMKLKDTAITEFGKLNILVNNAGSIELQSALLSVADDATYHHQMELLVYAPFKLTQLCLDELKKASGTVVNVSSIAGLRPGMGLYSMAKAALNMFTQNAALEFGPQGVRVNAVCPGFVHTGFQRAAGFTQTKAQDDKMLKFNMQTSPLRKLTASQDCANLIMFLASDLASRINGCCVPIDGGFSMLGQDNQTTRYMVKALRNTTDSKL